MEDGEIGGGGGGSCGGGGGGGGRSGGGIGGGGGGGGGGCLVTTRTAQEPTPWIKLAVPNHQMKLKKSLAFSEKIIPAFLYPTPLLEIFSFFLICYLHNQNN